MLIPYYKIVSRKEVFGAGDTGKNTVIKLITNEDSKLEPLPNASVADKEKYNTVTSSLLKNGFIHIKNGYFEFKKELTENEAKRLLESIGFNEYD